MPRLAANLSLLFADRPLPERFAAARRAGFDEVEIQFPYSHSIPELATACQAAGVRVVLINLPAGDLMQGGDGLACVPAQTDAFVDALQQGLAYATALDVQCVNVLAGRLPAGVSRQQALTTLTGRLQLACRTFAPHGITVTCEAINPLDMPRFLVNDCDDMEALRQAVGCDNFGLQFDIYHMARQQHDVTALLEKHAAHIVHIQFADCPGRGVPGTGSLDFKRIFMKIREIGYRGSVAAELLDPDGTFTTSRCNF